MTSAVAERASLKAPALVGLAGASAMGLLYLRDPHTEGSYGICPFLAMTGVPCPGCGGLRAMNNLTHGDLVGAISSNVLAVALVATLAVAWVIWVVRRVRDGYAGPMIALSPRVSVALVGVVVIFGVVRNLPGGQWLAP